MISLCVPVLRRYDLLRDLLQSLETSTVKPDAIYVADNGQEKHRLKFALQSCQTPTLSYTPLTPMGVAESWNYFIDTAPSDWLICNDDIAFAPRSIEMLIDANADLAWAKGVGFGCFLLRPSCVEKLGKFDEAISPGYGYYEDEDYLQRLDGRGTREPSAIAATVDCGVKHFHSATLKAASNIQLQEHHRRFKLAQRNYMKKWNVTDEQMFGKAK